MFLKLDRGTGKVPGALLRQWVAGRGGGTGQGRTSPAVPFPGGMGQSWPHPGPGSGEGQAPGRARRTRPRSPGETGAFLLAFAPPTPGSFAETITALGFPAMLPLNLIAARYPPLQPRHEPTFNITN